MEIKLNRNHYLVVVITVRPRIYSLEIKLDKTIKLERMKRHDRVKSMIYPEDKFKSSWDVLITLILLITCIILPARIAFIKPLEAAHTIQIWIVINTVLDLFFLVELHESRRSLYQ